MTTKTIDHRPEQTRTNDDVSMKSNEGNGTDTSDKQYKKAAETSKEFVESVEKQVFNKEAKGELSADEIRKVFTDSADLSEKAIDALITMQSEQLNSVVDFNRKLADTLRNMDYSNKQELTDFLELIRKSFEDSSERMMNNTRKMSDLYEKHVKHVMNLNDQFSRNINRQFQVLNMYAAKNADLFSEWTMSWWKPTPIDHYDLDKE